MKFGTQLGSTFKIIFGYRAITEFAHNKNGRRFLNGYNINTSIIKIPGILTHM